MLLGESLKFWYLMKFDELRKLNYVWHKLRGHCVEMCDENCSLGTKVSDSNTLQSFDVNVAELGLCILRVLEERLIKT